MRLPSAWLALVCGLVALGAEPSGLRLEGELVQGGLVRGQVAPGSCVHLDGQELRVSEDGWFVFGFDRDAPKTALLAIQGPDGSETVRRLEVGARSFKIQRIDGLPPRQVAPSEADLERIRSDAELIAAVRRRDSDGRGFTEAVVWPARGRISGVYGSQRILNGEPRAPHRGLDVAAPAGTPVGAMARGVVSLAATDMYYTGNTVMVDHGHGLHSIYAHLQAILVEVGQEVAQGRTLGTVGASGRATGPHLHWGVYWFERVVDPALLVGAEPLG